MCAVKMTAVMLNKPQFTTYIIGRARRIQALVSIVHICHNSGRSHADRFAYFAMLHRFPHSIHCCKVVCLKSVADPDARKRDAPYTMAQTVRYTLGRHTRNRWTVRDFVVHTVHSWLITMTKRRSWYVSSRASVVTIFACHIIWHIIVS